MPPATLKNIRRKCFLSGCCCRAVALGRLTRLLLPHRHPLAVRRATRPDPSRRPDSVADYRRLLRPLWPLALAAVALLAALAVWAAQPSQRLHTVQLASGQTLLVREVQRLPQRQVAIVAPADTATLTGRMVIPAAVRHRGLRWQVVAIETALDSITLPDALEEIGPYAFAYCDSLRVVRMGSKVRSIGSYCFTECHRLREVEILSPVPPEVQSTTFNQLPPSAILRVPSHALDAYRAHPLWGRFNVRCR